MKKTDGNGGKYRGNKKDAKRASRNARPGGAGGQLELQLRVRHRGLGWWLRNTAFVLLAVAALTAGALYYAFKIEPYRVSVNEYALDAGGNVAAGADAAGSDAAGSDAAAGADGRTDAGEPSVELVIAQISDLHIKEDFTVENLGKVIRRLNEAEPDLVIFTGDLYDNYAKMNDDKALVGALSGIRAKYGKIAIWGNRDYGGGAVRKYEAIMEGAGFRLLKNENALLSLDKGKTLLVTGLDDALLGDPHMPQADAPEADYSVLLTHEPDVSDDYRDLGYRLILSGHSHGGQVRLPFVRIVTTALGEKYIGGMYPTDRENGRYLYVNTGIGTTHISARFGVVPEIALFRISV